MAEKRRKARKRRALLNSLKADGNAPSARTTISRAEKNVTGARKSDQSRI